MSARSKVHISITAQPTVDSRIAPGKQVVSTIDVRHAVLENALPAVPHPVDLFVQAQDCVAIGASFTVGIAAQSIGPVVDIVIGVVEVTADFVTVHLGSLAL